jgi:hypothetical protein
LLLLFAFLFFLTFLERRCSTTCHIKSSLFRLRSASRKPCARLPTMFGCGEPPQRFQGAQESALPVEISNRPYRNPNCAIAIAFRRLACIRAVVQGG